MPRIRIARTLLATAVALAALPAGAQAATPRTLWRGTFASLGGHSISGTAKVVRLRDGRRRLVLRPFSTESGPDLRVWLVAGRVPVSGAVPSYRSVGRLARTSGAQSYAIGRRVDLSRFKSVVVWCEDFSVAFGAARLARVR